MKIDKSRIDIVQKLLWQILVPTVSNEGKPYRTRYHRVWDRKVWEVSGGLTITPPVVGQWVNNEDILFKERMIPVQIACTEAEIITIAEMTKKYYSQEKVFVYLLSQKAYIL